MAVSGLLSAILLLLFQARSKMTLADKENDFFTACPPSYCGKGEPEIRYPFRLNSSSPDCGARDLVLSCSENITLLSLSESGSHRVTAINYQDSEITIKLGDRWSDCQVQNSTSLTTPIYKPLQIFSLVNCSKEWNRRSTIFKEQNIVTPSSCLSSADHFVYMADMDMPTVLLPSDCVVVSTNLVIPELGTSVEKEGVTLHWYVPEIDYACQVCESEGVRCEFNRTINQASCSFPEQPGSSDVSHIILITGKTDVFHRRAAILRETGLTPPSPQSDQHPGPVPKAVP